MTRGPIPKRTEIRQRRNATGADGLEVRTAAALPAEAYEADPNWHDVAATWYESHAESGQARFYQQSDWATLYLVADQISRHLQPQYVGMVMVGGGRQEPQYETTPMAGSTLAAILKASSVLGSTEGDRLRMKIQLEAGGAEQAPTGTPGQQARAAAMAKLGLSVVEGGA